MENPSSPPGRDEHPDRPIPIQDVDKPMPSQGNPAPSSGVSRAPLSLGSPGDSRTPKTAPQAPPRPPGAPTGAPAGAPTGAPGPAAGQAPKPMPKPAAPVAAAPAGGRTVGVKTFFTKLHPGAIEFLDEQITAWLKQNPQIVIKSTNSTVGEVQAKKTEPNIIITVWY